MPGLGLGLAPSLIACRSGGGVNQAFAAPEWPVWGPAENIGNRPTSAAYQEHSGMARGARPENANYIWLKSDGTGIVLHTQNVLDGTEAGVWSLAGYGAMVDAEDAASAVVDGVPYVWIADVGDNGNARSTIVLVRCAEPEIYTEAPETTYPFGTELVRYQFENDGTIVNSGTGGATYDSAFNGNASYTTTAKFGTYAYVGDGTGDSVDTKFGNGINPSTTGFSISCWARRNGTGGGGDQHVFGFANTGASIRWYCRYRQASGVWGMRVQGQAEVLTAIPVTLNQWYHVCMVADPVIDQVRLYIDGVLRANGSYTSFTLNGNIHCGTNNENGSIAHAEGWDGEIDDFAIYNFTLTQEQVEDIRNAGVSGGAFGGNIEAGDRVVATCAYPGGAAAPSHKDCETILADTNGDVYFITKRITPARLYRLPFAASYTGTQTLEYLGTIWTPPQTVGMDGSNAGYIVGGDISHDGKLIVLRGYEKVYWFHRLEGQSIYDALQVEGHEVTNYVGKGTHPTQEPKGEACTILQNGDLLTVSEYLSGHGSGDGYPTFLYPRDPSPENFVVWGAPRSKASIPFEQAWQNLSSSDFLRLVYEEGLHTGSYADADEYIEAVEALFLAAVPWRGPEAFRPDGIISFLTIRQDAEYFDFEALGLYGSPVGPGEHGGLAIAGDTGTLDVDPPFDTITRTSGSWIDDGFKRGDVIGITNAEDSANNIGNIDRRIQVFDVTDTVLYCSIVRATALGDQQLTTNANDTTAIVRVMNKSEAPTAFRDHFRAIYEASTAGRSRLLTSQTQQNIAQNEGTFVSDAFDGRTYGIYYGADKTAGIDTDLIWSNGGGLVFPTNSTFVAPISGPGFGWNDLIHNYFCPPNPARVASYTASDLPSDWKVTRFMAEYLRPRFHKLNIVSGAGGPAAGTFKIGFPYASTELDDIVGFDFNSSAQTITRNDGGSWVAEGYEVGLFVRVNSGANAGCFEVATVTASVLTVTSGLVSTLSAQKAVTFDAIEKTADIDADLPGQAFVGIEPIRPAGGFTVTGSNTITRTDGRSFVEDGFVASSDYDPSGASGPATPWFDEIVIENAGSNNGTFTLTAVTASTLTVSGTPLSNVSNDLNMTVRREPQPQLRWQVKQALDALTHTPECATMHWYDRRTSANTRRILLIMFFDAAQTNRAWAYNPPYPGHVVGPDAGSGFTFTNNTPGRDTITRTDGGSWVTDGFVAGGGLRVQNAANSANNGCYRIHSVSESVLTLKNRNYTQITQSGIQGDFPLSLTTSSGDNTATFRHTGYGVPVHAAPEMISTPTLYIEQSGVGAEATVVSSEIDTGDGTVSLETGTSDANYTTADTNTPAIDLDWLDDDGHVTCLGGKCVPQPSTNRHRQWFQDYFTPYFQEYKDLGGPELKYVHHDFEPSWPGSFDLTNLQTGTDAVLMGGHNATSVLGDSLRSPSQGTEGLAAERNYATYVLSRDDWNGMFNFISPGVRATIENGVAYLGAGNQLQGTKNPLLQFQDSFNRIIRGQHRGVSFAIKAAFPNASLVGPHKSYTSCDMIGHQPLSFANFYGMFGFADDCQMESCFGLAESLQDGDRFYDTFPSTESDNCYAIFPLIPIKEIERDDALVTTVRTFDTDEIRANAYRGNFKQFNGYFVGQYVRCRQYLGTKLAGMGTFAPDTGGGTTQTRWHVWKPILSVTDEEITVQDFYYRDSVNGIDLGNGGSNRITRKDGYTWANDGWVVGESVMLTNGTNGAYDGTYTVTGVTSTIMTVSGTPFGTPQNNDTSVRVSKAVQSVLTPAVSDDFEMAGVTCANNWHDLLYNLDHLRTCYKASLLETFTLKNTYNFDKKAKYVVNGGLLGALVDDLTLDYHAEIFFHMKLHDAKTWTYTGPGQVTSHPEQVGAGENVHGLALAHIYEVCPYNKVKPLSLNSQKIRKKTAEWVVSGAVLPNNTRLFRVTLRQDMPQDMTVPGAVAQSTHTPGPLFEEDGYVIFQDRFGNQFAVPGALVEADDFNTVGWWTLAS